MAKSRPLLRRLTLSILMPLLLLLSQQGALLHELSHWHITTGPAAVGAQAQAADADEGLCLTCLAFAQAGGLARFDVPAVPSLDHLGYHFGVERLRHVADATSPATRNRGPPAAA